MPLLYPRLDRTQWFAVFTCIATYTLILIGGIVRITDSGLGCPDWPLCHGNLIPPAEKAVLIEFSHRTAATIVGGMVVVLGLLVWRRYRAPLVRRLMLAAFPLLLFQAGLGGVTVKRELPASIVAFHHGTAMLFLALLVIITSIMIMTDRGRPGSPFHALAHASYPRWVLGTALALLALMVSGSYTAASHAGLAFPDWPLFAGRLLPDGGRLQDIHFLHRVTAAAVGVIILVLAGYTRGSQPRGSVLQSLAGTAVAIYAVQVVVGAGNIWTGLNQGVAAAHLALGALLWITMIVLFMMALYDAEPEAASSARRAPARSATHGA